MMDRICEWCKNPYFRKEESRFCSIECDHASRKAGSKLIICDGCGTTFKKRIHHIKLANYCKVCTTAIREANPCRCVTCGKITEWGRDWCSLECLHSQWSNERHDEIYMRTCRYCQKRYRYNGTIFCTDECRKQMLEKTGDLFYTNGAENYRGPNWLRQKRLAYARDKGICLVCGLTPEEGQRRNSVHHITPFKEFGTDYRTANSLWNLATLCGKCHSLVEWNKVQIPESKLIEIGYQKGYSPKDKKASDAK